MRIVPLVILKQLSTSLYFAVLSASSITVLCGVCSYVLVGLSYFKFCYYYFELRCFCIYLNIGASVGLISIGGICAPKYLLKAVIQVLLCFFKFLNAFTNRAFNAYLALFRSHPEVRKHRKLLECVLREIVVAVSSEMP